MLLCCNIFQSGAFFSLWFQSRQEIRFHSLHLEPHRVTSSDNGWNICSYKQSVEVFCPESVDYIVYNTIFDYPEMSHHFCGKVMLYFVKRHSLVELETPVISWLEGGQPTHT